MVLQVLRIQDLGQLRVPESKNASKDAGAPGYQAHCYLEYFICLE